MTMPNDTPTPPTLADLRGEYNATLPPLDFAYRHLGPSEIAAAEENNECAWEAVIAAAQREAVSLYWCPSCRTLRPTADTGIHSCYDADAVQRARIAELEAEVAALREDKARLDWLEWAAKDGEFDEWEKLWYSPLLLRVSADAAREAAP